MTKKQQADIIYKILLKTYPDAHMTVEFKNPEYLLFANVLSSQTPDTTVNKVMKVLWKKYPGAKYIAKAPISDLEHIIHSIGFHHIKAQNLKRTAEILLDEFNGVVPQNLEDLMKFRGIGRKMGLVLMTEAFGKVEGIIVDTHNIRVSGRLGLTDAKNALGVEKDLMKIIPKDRWRAWSHLMVFHGRAICVARNPKCSICPVKSYCRYYKGVYLKEKGV